MDDKERPPFRRALYDPAIREAYADNAPDPLLFQELRRNVHVTIQSYPDLVLGTQAITQHLLGIAVLVGVFLHLHSERLGPSTLLWCTVIGTILGWAIWEGRDPSRRRLRFYAAQSSASLALILVLLSPILKTLAYATTSDSITSLTCALFALNALLADYRAPRPADKNRGGLPGALSLNAAISASTVLASRLSRPRDAHARVFALLLFSFVWFALFPTFRKDLRRTATLRSALTLTLALAIIACALISPISISACVALSTSSLALSFGAPAVLVHAQRYKDEIRGPWDAAVPSSL